MQYETITEEEALLITPDMLIQIPAKGNEVKNLKKTFEKNMSVLPVFIVMIIISNVVSYVFEMSTGALLSEQTIIQAGALKGQLVLEGQYWRLMSAGFLHASIQHLFSNLIFMYILGMATEHAFGFKRMVLIYFGALLTGSLVSMTMGDQTSVGASGALFGLMGGLIVYFRKNSQQFNIRDGNIGIFIAIIAVIQIASGFTSPHIDNYAHIGGFLGGSLLAWLLKSQLGTEEESVSIGRGAKISIFMTCLIVPMIWLFMKGYLYVVVAEVSIYASNVNAAIKYSTQALVHNPENAYAYIVRGEAYLASKKLEAATQDILLYVAAHPTEGTGYITLGEIARANEDYVGALKYYVKGIAAHPEPDLYNHLGYTKILMGDYVTSRTDFQNAIKLDKNYAPGYGNLGLLDAIDGSYEVAIKQLKKSYELDPSLKVINKLIAGLEEEQKGNQKAAIRSYQSFIDKTDNNPSWQAEHQFAVAHLKRMKEKK